MKKVVSIFIISIFMLGSVNFPSKAASFTDITPTQTFGPSVLALSEKGIIAGFPDQTYRPDEPMKRQDVAVLLGRAIPLQEVRPKTFFKDVPVTTRTYSSVMALYQAGIINGDSSGRFQLEAPLTRAQMAIMLKNGLALERTHLAPLFEDVPAHHWAAEAIYTLVEHGIAFGLNEKEFRPDEAVTRGQYAMFLHRALTFAGGGEITRPTHTPPQPVPFFEEVNGTYAHYGLTLGMTKSDVQLLLGPPTEIITPADIPQPMQERHLYEGQNIEVIYHDGRVDTIYLTGTWPIWKKELFERYPEQYVTKEQIHYLFNEKTEDLVVVKNDGYGSHAFLTKADENFYHYVFEEKFPFRK